MKRYQILEILIKLCLKNNRQREEISLNGGIKTIKSKLFLHAVKTIKVFETYQKVCEIVITFMRCFRLDDENIIPDED